MCAVRHFRPEWICGLFVLWVLAANAADQEPSYSGRLLSQWLGDLVPGQVGVSPTDGAVRAMGTNAIPTLLSWIGYEAHSESASQPVPSERSLRSANPMANPEERAERAVYAFRFLGDVGRPAIPELTGLARRSSDQHRAERCADALAAIGPEAMPSLLSLAINGPSPTRFYAVAALEFFVRDPAAAPAVPVLIECMGGTNEVIADEATTILSEINLPAVVVPALTNALHSPDGHVGRRAASCLTGAVPRLRVDLTDRDYHVRAAATNALHAITSEAVALYGFIPDFFTNVPGSNLQGGANGRQPLGSETNRTSAAAASRRSP